MYWRKGLATVPLTTRGENTAGTPASSYTQFYSSELEEDGYAPGVRASLNAEILDHEFALSAFFLAPMGIEGTKLRLSTSPNNTDAIYDNAPGGAYPNTPNSDLIYGLNIHHETKLFGAEANAVRPLGIPGLSVGVSAIYFGEELGSTGIDAADSVPALGGTADKRDNVSIRVDNRLLGLQVGLQHMFDVGDFIRMGGSIKGGLYNNFVDRNRTFVSENHQDRSFEATDHKNVVAQGVEFNPRVEFKLSEGTYLTASGQFLWLNNVSTALPHYATATVGADHDVRANDDVYFYGGSLGMTVLLDESSPISNSLPPFAYHTPYVSDIDDVDEHVTELEESTTRKGNSKVSLAVSGWINRMVLFWDDGAKKDAYIVDNTASRSRISFEGAAKIARGWSAGYLLSLGLDDTASNDVSQLTDDGENQIELRHSAWWLRSNLLGTVTVGHTSTATDNIILKDVGGIMPGAANMATIGGSFIMRHADSFVEGDGALVSSGAFTTDLNDMIAGGSVDTLRRDIIRYDAPRLSGQFGNVDLSVAWGEDDFFDAAIEHSINYNDWRFRFGAGYLNDTSEARENSRRNRSEYKGSASLLHIPTGLFGTAAYVRRTFNGGYDLNTTLPQTVYGETVSPEYDASEPDRPPIDYLYTAFGLRRSYWSLGDTSIYGEYGQVWDSIKGLREADYRAALESRVMMLGAAICQDIDNAGMDVYAGVRVYSFDTEGLNRYRPNNNTPYTYYVSPVPLADLVLGYAGTRIKF